MYVGITRARKRLYLSYANERMQYYQYAHNAPSRFLKEIPARLITESFSRARQASRFADAPAPFAAPRSAERTYRDAKAVETRRPVSGIPGKPKLTFKGLGLNEIPGVRKGFVPSAAHEIRESAVDAIFAVKDRVRHPKFGAGTVVDVTGHGKDARIRIAFDDKGEKELALAIAPIVRIEEET